MAAYTAKIRPYKDFLTPALHRRFINGLSVCFVLCYLESVIIGEKNSIFWIWFPLGATGLRAILLFISTLCIFLLRVAQLHIGFRTSYSGWHTFRSYAFRFQTLQTAVWYCISAFLFCETYIWSSSQEAGLSRTKIIPRTNRSTLNENPIYLTCFFLFTAFIQASIHLINDNDRIEIPVKKFKTAGSSKLEAESTSDKLKARLPSLALISAKRSVSITLISPFIYAFRFPLYPYSIRKLAWSLNRSWAKIFWTLPRSGSLPTKWPFHWKILWICTTSGFLLIFLWEVSNAAFSAYTAQEPLKNGRPITQESRDPNGSLINGLKSQKFQIRVYAFWELSYICHKLKTRRKTIYNDIDRVGGSSWSQVRDACLDVIGGIKTRINNYQSTSVCAAYTPENVSSLPRLSGPLKEGLQSPGDIFTAAPKLSSTSQGVSRAMQKIAKNRGQTMSSGLSPKAKKLLNAAGDVILTKQQRQKISKIRSGGFLTKWVLKFLQSYFGWPFRREYQRALATVVLGSPYGDIGIIIDAIESLTKLVICSLTEDQFGEVQRDIKTIILELTTTVIGLEELTSIIGLHWTDVIAIQKSPEVDQILDSLKKSLSMILGAFEQYSEHIGLSKYDLKMAKEAASVSRLEKSSETDL
ncbi:putative nuclear envelope protein [Erysiphe necator]|uniref:Putative nuclear envelope protein n=1 Tax=Uncinula necator TaxID=52586 RepID=A0A0B1PGX8_UNCNE|nr:putative nuclear envelope protein [Erysiphe necator]